MKQNTLFGIARFEQAQIFIEGSGATKFAHQVIQLFDVENRYSGSILIHTYLLDDKKDENSDRLWKFDIQFSFLISSEGNEHEFKRIDMNFNRRELTPKMLELVSPVGMGQLHIVGYPNFFGAL